MNRLYEKLAVLAVRRGVNVQKGQKLVIRSDVRDQAFAQLCAEEAYKAGAGSVEIDWRDQTLKRLDLEYQTVETLADISDWIHAKEEERQKRKACYLNIVSDEPGAMKQTDPEKRSAYQRAYSAKMADLQRYTAANEGQWCVLGVPSVKWAHTVFPELSEEEAFAKLEEAIFAVSRVSEDNDPIADWQKHDESLQHTAGILTEYQFEKVHFYNSLGTDLYVGLVKDHIWVGGGTETPKGVYFDPNIPTEEIFCMPDKYQTEGIVYASKPLSFNGTLIEDFNITFHNGKAVEVHAAKEEKVLQEITGSDEGSAYLGEVALVPYDSPVSKAGFLFYNTLYDENAACHLALGQCYAENLKGGLEMSDEDLQKAGGNISREHVDFMFGTADLSADGIQKDGTAVPIMRNGNIVLED